MEDADRIRALRDQGRIDDAQAERLLAALGALETAGERTGAERGDEADGVAPRARGGDRSGQPAEHPPEATRPAADAADAGANAGPPTTQAPLPAGAGATPAMASATTPSTDASAIPAPTPDDAAGVEGRPTAVAHRPREEGARPQAEGGGVTTDAGADGATATPDAASTVVRRWARVEMLAGELEVRVDASLDAPVAESTEGELDVAADGDGWRVSQRAAREGGNWLERLVDGLKRSKVRLRVPADTGLDVDLKAGDVELDGVPALRARLLAGDLDAVGLRAVDVTLQAGDLDLALAPAPGAHRIRMTAGDAEIRLPRDADVAIRGRVSVGDVSAPEPLRTNRSTVSERVEGTLGAGRASLSIEMVTGDLDIVVG